MVLDPIPQILPVHFFGSRPQPPTSHIVYEWSCIVTIWVYARLDSSTCEFIWGYQYTYIWMHIHVYIYTQFIDTYTYKLTHLQTWKSRSGKRLVRIRIPNLSPLRGRFSDTWESDDVRVRESVFVDGKWLIRTQNLPPIQSHDVRVRASEFVNGKWRIRIQNLSPIPGRFSDTWNSHDVCVRESEFVK